MNEADALRERLVELERVIELLRFDVHRAGQLTEMWRNSFYVLYRDVRPMAGHEVENLTAELEAMSKRVRATLNG